MSGYVFGENICKIISLCVYMYMNVSNPNFINAHLKSTLKWTSSCLPMGKRKVCFRRQWFNFIFLLCGDFSIVSIRIRIPNNIWRRKQQKVRIRNQENQTILLTYPMECYLQPDYVDYIVHIIVVRWTGTLSEGSEKYVRNEDFQMVNVRAEVMFIQQIVWASAHQNNKGYLLVNTIWTWSECLYVGSSSRLHYDYIQHG